MAIPHDIESEQAVLASLALKPALADDVRARLGDDPLAFFDRKHQAIYPALLNLAQRGEMPDEVTVGAEVQRLGLLRNFKGRGDFVDYFRWMCEQVPTVSNYASYISTVKHRHLLRCLVELCNQTAEDSVLPERSVHDLVLQFEREGNRLRARADENPRLRFGDVGEEVLEDAVDRVEAAKLLAADGVLGLPSGIPGLTELVGGWKPGNLIVVGGSSGGGKSTAMMQLADAIAESAPSRHNGNIDRGGVLLVSLEMKPRELVGKLLFGEAGVDSRAVDDGKLTQNQLAQIEAALTNLRNRRIFIDYLPQPEWPLVHARILLARDEEGIEATIIDYVQKITKPPRVDKKDHVAEMAQNLKALAGRLDIPVIGLAQLKTKPKKNGKEPRPYKEDLGESSYMYKDADIVVLLWNKGAPVEATAPESHKLGGTAKPDAVALVDFIVDKQRSGRKGDVPTLFNQTLGRFLPPPDPKVQFLGGTLDAAEQRRKDLA